MDSEARSVTMTPPASEPTHPHLMHELRRLSEGAWHDALHLAELQAELVRSVMPWRPRLSTELLERLPHIHVERSADLPVAGTARWDGECWIVELNSADSPQQQRWTLLHEIKHIIDHPRRNSIYGGRSPLEAAELAERAADFFAVAALMPERAVMVAWRLGLRHPPKLAAHFDVAEGAARLRLHQIGLTDHYLRSRRTDCGWHRTEFAT